MRFALAFALTIVAWACAHDIRLVGVEPRHFTVYHRPLLPISNHTLLAVQYAFVATVGPGLAFGFLAWAASRGGSRPPRRLAPVLLGFLGLIAAVETALIFVGHRAAQLAEQGRPPLYPEFLYPEFTVGMVHTQTVNLTAYWLAPVCGAFYLFAVFLTRPRRTPEAPQIATTPAHEP